MKGRIEAECFGAHAVNENCTLVNGVNVVHLNQLTLQ